MNANMESEKKDKVEIHRRQKPWYCIIRYVCINKHRLIDKQIGHTVLLVSDLRRLLIKIRLITLITLWSNTSITIFSGR